MFKAAWQKREREREIVRELSKLSRDGWQHATPEEYVSLEHELRKLQDRRE